MIQTALQRAAKDGRRVEKDARAERGVRRREVLWIKEATACE